MFNISQVFGPSNRNREATFNISRVLSDFRLTCLTFPAVEAVLKISGLQPLRFAVSERFSFNMFNVSRVLGCVKTFWELTFNISRVLSNFRLTCLTFPGL